MGELHVYLLLTKKDGDVKDKGSSAFLEIGTLVMFGVTVILQIYEIGELNVTWVSHLGLLITLLGVLFRQYSIYILGIYFSGFIRLKKDHQLIQHGPYKYFRHPSYFGSVLSYLGLGLASSNIYSLILLPIGISILYIYRIKVEEELMFKSFGNQYKTYRDKTWGFLPFIK
jgi:protein-S-isoprenylcysteine O-methyltransferase Ste14